MLHVRLSADLLREDAELRKLNPNIPKARDDIDKEIQASVEKELSFASAQHDPAEKRKYQNESLHHLVTTYFRILKMGMHVKPDLLAPALEGLSRLCHFVNMDLIEDLLEALRELVLEAEKAEREHREHEKRKNANSQAQREKLTPLLPIEASLHAVLTAFLTLRGPAHVLAIDARDFFLHLYAIVPRLALLENQDHIPLAIRCLESMLLHTKQYTAERVAAFAKRLLTLSLHVQSHFAIGILSFVRKLLTRYSQAYQILEKPTERMKPGSFRCVCVLA